MNEKTKSSSSRFTGLYGFKVIHKNQKPERKSIEELNWDLEEVTEKAIETLKMKKPYQYLTFNEILAEALELNFHSKADGFLDFPSMCKLYKAFQSKAKKDGIVLSYYNYGEGADVGLPYNLLFWKNSDNKLLNKYVEKYGEIPPKYMMTSYMDDVYQKLLKKALDRGTPITNRDIGYAYRGRKFDKV